MTDHPDELTLFADDQQAAAIPLMSPEEAQRRRQLQLMSADERLQGILNVHQLRQQLQQGSRVNYTPSRPCPCGSVDAEIRQSGDQLPVSCRVCGRAFYNAPKLEVGLKARTVANLRRGISARSRARILDRDHGRCVLCGTTTNVTIGHLLSVADGEKVGASQEELYSEANLASMCETCNSGLGSQSISLLTFTIMHHLLRAELHRADAYPASFPSDPRTRRSDLAPDTARGMSEP